LGNLVMVRDLLQRYSADALRLYLGEHHYRERWSYHEPALQAATELAHLLEKAATANGGPQAELDPTPVQATFIQTMDDDLQTPKALNALANLAEQINLAAAQEQNVRRAQATLRALSSIFGVRLGATAPEPPVVTGWHAHAAKFR
jgi:cysteinyl-tRNA synthetase